MYRILYIPSGRFIRDYTCRVKFSVHTVYIDSAEEFPNITKYYLDFGVVECKTYIEANRVLRQALELMEADISEFEIIKYYA